MKKVFLSFLLFLLCGSSAFGELISPEEALLRANRDLHHAPGKSSSLTGLRLVDTRTVEGLPTVYVFENSDKQCVLLPADNVAEPILGYIDRWADNEADMPPALVEWLEGYGRQIAAARAAGVEPVESKVDVHRASLANIQPMLATLWNQGEPYNNKTPMIDGENCVTGCVATAMAQIMKYHRYPAVGSGTHSYEWNEQTMTIDFSNYSFDWNNMLNRYDGEYTSAQADAVANLMYVCGMSVDMAYGLNASSAFSRDAAIAFRDFFGFRKDVHFEHSSYYSSSDWEKLIHNQLKTYGPVYFSANNNSSGHAFVCDGYRTGGYFHINWGWGGYGDGYFLLSAMSPDGSDADRFSNGYNFDHTVIVNLAPDDGSTSIYYDFTCGGMTPDRVSYNFGERVTFAQGFYSIYSAIFAGELGFKLVDESGNEKYLVCAKPTELKPGWGYSSFYFTVSNSYSPGRYIITPVWRQTDGEWHNMKVKYSEPQYAVMTISDNVATFTWGDKAEVSVTDFNQLTPGFTNDPMFGEVTVNNPGNVEYNSYIRCYIFSENGESLIGHGDMLKVLVQPGVTSTVSYVSKFVTEDGEVIAPGKYQLVFTDDEDDVISSAHLIEFKEKPNAKIAFSNFKIEGDASKADRHNLHFTADLACTEGYFVDKLTLYIYPMAINQTVSSVISCKSQWLTIAPGITSKVDFYCDFADGNLGRSYFANVYYDNEKLEGRVFFTLDVVDGVVDATAIAEVATVEVYDFMGVYVASSTADLAPGCYIIRTVYSDGTTNIERVLVK